MSDPIREELDALNLLLGRDSLWAPVLTSAGEPLVDDTRDRFERRRDELSESLAEKKVTTLTGYVFFTASDGGIALAMPSGDLPPVEFADLFPAPIEWEKPLDIEITVKVRPHCATRKETAA